MIICLDSGYLCWNLW